MILLEVRPIYPRPGEYAEYGYAKATYVKKTKKWKVFWLRANLKWDRNPPKPIVNTLSEFVQLVEEDKHHCFKR